jgi:hypothetical protein
MSMSNDDQCTNMWVFPTTDGSMALIRYAPAHAIPGAIFIHDASCTGGLPSPCAVLAVLKGAGLGLRARLPACMLPCAVAPPLRGLTGARLQGAHHHRGALGHGALRRASDTHCNAPWLLL